jgi:2-C-methyl-D-erythritol 4-phosphate cytidylyltransferase
VLPVVPEGADGALEELRRDWSGSAELLGAVSGGETRQDSVACGIRALARVVENAEWVLVHDAARCLVLPEDAEAVLACARETGAAIPVVPVADTVKEVEGERVVRTLDRSRLVATQTPQAFRVSLLREALEKAERDGFLGTDCASLVERLGVAVRTTPGRPENYKVTGPSDLERAVDVLRARAGSL